MNKETFLWRLMEGLSQLEESERTQVAAYYQELVLDGVESGKTEEEVVAGFGEPAAVARQILDERGSLREKEKKFKREYEQSINGEERAYCPKEPVETVLVQVRDRRVEVRTSEDGMVRVWFAAREGDRISVDEANGAFRFIHKASFFNGMLLNFGGGKKAVVEIPRHFEGTVCIQTTNSRIEAEDLQIDGRLQMITTNGRLQVRDCALMMFSGKTSNGRVALENVAGVMCGAASSNGRIEAKNCRLSEGLRLETSNGAIHIDGVDAPDLSFRTSNGAIKGTVAGRGQDYSAKGSTTNGHVRIDGGGGPKKLLAVTTNGSIEIGFQEGHPTDMSE